MEKNKKTKVVYNACYGGFGLSDEAVKWLEANASDQNVRDFLKNKRIEIEEKKKQGPDWCFSVEDLMGTSLLYDFNEKGIPRHHKDLVACVETLGNDASGICSRLAIAEIEGKKYRVDEYDGWESVYTPDSYDWVIIEKENEHC